MLSVQLQISQTPSNNCWKYLLLPISDPVLLRFWFSDESNNCMISCSKLSSSTLSLIWCRKNHSPNWKWNESVYILGDYLTLVFLKPLLILHDVFRHPLRRWQYRNVGHMSNATLEICQYIGIPSVYNTCREQVQNQQSEQPPSRTKLPW